MSNEDEIRVKPGGWKVIEVKGKEHSRRDATGWPHKVRSKK